MGYTFDTVRGFRAGTDRKFTLIVDRRVWVITGEGRPTRYYLAGYFRAAKFQHWIDGQFKWLISAPATAGVELPPQACVAINKRLKWFKNLQKATRNFNGMQPIRDPDIIAALEQVVAPALRPAEAIQGGSGAA